MSGHTPAPWAFLNHKGDESLLAFGIGSVEEMHDMDRYGWYSTWCMIKPEDARLIAAAPDLLEAARMLNDCLHIDLGDLTYLVREREGQGWDGPAVSQWSDGVTRLRSAIAKATGEQP